jgi:hypothetical protein
MAKKSKKESVAPAQAAEQENIPTSPKSGLSVSVNLEKVKEHGSDRLRVTVKLLQDGEVISEDSSYVRV